MRMKGKKIAAKEGTAGFVGAFFNPENDVWVLRVKSQSRGGG